MSLPQVTILLDTSGSMRAYKTTVAHHLPLVDKQLREHFDVQYINFSSNVAQYSSVTQCLSGWQGMGTNLVGAFKCLESKALSSTGQMCVVVLISDGAHEHYGTSIDELKLLKGMGDNCVLMTLAVGNNFPTDTVLEELLSVYQTVDNNDLCPVVFKIKSHFFDDEMCPDGETVFNMLCTAVLNVGNFVKEVEVYEGSSEEQCSIRLAQIVNQTMLRLTKGKRDKRDLAEAIRFETEVLQNGINAIVELQQFTKHMKTVNQKAEGNLAKLRSLREEATQGISIVNYTEVRRSELAAYGSMQYVANFEGKYCAVGLKRSKGDWDKELDSLIDYMKSFDRFDTGDGEIISAITQETEDEMMARIQLDMANFQRDQVPPFESSGMSKAEYQLLVSGAIEENRDAMHGAMTDMMQMYSLLDIKHQGYARLMGGEGFRKGLVTVYKTAQGEFQCPDLSKAIFAFLVHYNSVQNPTSMELMQKADALRNVEALKLRRHCTLVELYASCKKKPSETLIQFLTPHTACKANIDRFVDLEALCAKHTTKNEVVAAFISALNEALQSSPTLQFDMEMPTTLCDAQSFGKSAASVDRMFRSIGKLVGLELPPLTTAENVDALVTAARHEGNTQLRAERTVEAVGVSLDDVVKEFIAPALVKVLLREAPTYTSSAYDAWYDSIHSSVHPLPEAYVPLLIEDGIIKDVRDLALTPSRLSACMCFATGCPHFGKVMGVVQRHPVTGDYLTTPELREHIASDYVPGYHKTFVQLCTTKTDLEIYNAIKNGTCLYPDERVKERLHKTFKDTSTEHIASLREPLVYEQWKLAFIASQGPVPAQ